MRTYNVTSANAHIKKTNSLHALSIGRPAQQQFRTFILITKNIKVQLKLKKITGNYGSLYIFAGDRCVRYEEVA